MEKQGKWLILQLSETCDLEQQVDQVVNEIRNSFGKSIPYYVPIKTETVEDKKISSVLFDGYVFVKCLDEAAIHTGINKMSGVYFRPLTYNGRLQFAKDADIENFNKNIEKKIDSVIPEIGALIIPKEGTFKDMKGIVLEINTEEKAVTAVFKMPSREVTALIKIINLK